MMQPMPRVPPFDRPATYEDLVALDDLFIAEIIGGELYGTRRFPTRAGHASTVLGARAAKMYDLGGRISDGWWVCLAPEIHLGPDVVVPDRAAWRRSRMLRLEDGRWTIRTEHLGAETVRAEPFREIELDLSAHWAD
jgi:hypothetical protein